jgi:hypothetical protein
MRAPGPGGLQGLPDLPFQEHKRRMLLTRIAPANNPRRGSTVEVSAL